MTEFFIRSRGSGYAIHAVSSKTLRGAKCAASRGFSEVVGNSLEVMVKVGPDYETVSVKPAFEKWRDVQ